MSQAIIAETSLQRSMHDIVQWDRQKDEAMT